MKTTQWPTADGRYYVTSYGNGWAYEITDQTTGQTLWVQDQDADELRTSTNNFECMAVLDDYFACLEA